MSILNDIIDQVDPNTNCDEYDETFAFDNILQHRKGKDRKYEALVQWVTGERI